MTTRAVPAVILLLFLSACAGGASSGQGSRLAGRDFVSSTVTGHTIVRGTQIQLGFREEGKLSAQAGCNHLFGDVAFEGDRMKVSGMGSTDMGCDRPRMDQDTWLTGFLQAGPKFALNGDELVLTGDKEVIKFVDRETAQPDRPLRGTRWVLESLIDGQSVSSVPQGVEAFLEFEGDRVTGNAGCNRMSGGAVAGDNKITFSDIVTTKMACVGDRGSVEGVVLRVLTGEAAMKIDGDLLELKHPNGIGLQLRSASEPRPTAS